MKSIQTIIPTGSLAAVLIMTAIFMNLQNKRSFENLPKMKDSKGFAVVELFTSEGCSSCPPADELIRRIQINSKNKQIYILYFHVDYWNNLGWKDKYSDTKFSKRQQQYANWLSLNTLYTPQIVVNGATESIGSELSPISRATSIGLVLDLKRALTLNCKIENGRIYIEYGGAGNKKDTELILALIQKSTQTKVQAGENSGKNLSHVQIVRQLLHIDIKNKNPIIINLPNNSNEKDWELIGFLQNKNNGRITDATRFDFKSAPTTNK